MNTSRLRKAMIAQRQQLSADEIMTCSTAILERCLSLPVFHASQHIGLYIAYNKEVDTTGIIAAAWRADKKVYLPVLGDDQHHLYFVEYTPDTVLETNRYGIFEPQYQAAEHVSCEGLDLVFTPLVAFDRNCHRIGMGAGCYDRSFSFLNEEPRPQRPALIGLAYEFQCMTYLEKQPWDVNLNAIVTESRIYSLDAEIK